jgi:hypothetical protein
LESRRPSFAESLFDEQFVAEDVIMADPVVLPAEDSPTFPPKAYQALAEFLDNPDSRNREHLSMVASELGRAVASSSSPPKVIGELLLRDGRVMRLRRLVTGATREVKAVADDVFNDIPEGERMAALSQFVGVLLQARDPASESPLLSARYHFFLRSLEGAFVVHWPEKKVLLQRQVQERDAAVFEVALCRQCGQHYFVGKITNGRLVEAVRDPGHPDFGAVFLCPVEGNATAGDDDENSARELRQLCVRCGCVWPTGGNGIEHGCEHGTSILVALQEGASEREDQIPKCLECGYQAPDPVREVVHGADGPHAVIATTLHQYLPDDRRKVLAFADGRQEAAFFAWYLQHSYDDIRDRSMILRAARGVARHASEGASLRDLASALRDLYKSQRVFPASRSDTELRREAWLALYREFVTDEPRISLEGVGLIQWSVRWPGDLEIPDALRGLPWAFSESEARDLLTVLLSHLRREGSVELRTEGGVSVSWADLGLQKQQKATEIVRPRRAQYVSSWTGKATARSGFLGKILEQQGVGRDDALRYADEALRAIWEAVRRWGEGRPDDGLLNRVGDAHRLNPDWWRALAIDGSAPLFECAVCGRLQSVSIRDVCSRHRCPGSLRSVRSSDLGENHYRMLYETDLPSRLRVEEHTAQIDKEKAREFQNDFKESQKENRINVLSCSTTFELGVDLGDLDTVFLRNVPPEAFNYAQRVGRAGRRSGFPGIAITYCRRNPHDLYHYSHLERMLEGKTQTPTLSIRNQKIILRHVSAVALASYFREHPERFENVGPLMGDAAQPDLTKAFSAFVSQNRAPLEAALRLIVPHGMDKEIGLCDASWIEKIAGAKSRLAWAESEVSSDCQSARMLQTSAAADEDYETAKWAKARVDTIMQEDVPSFLSRKAIIPKYGFPVDVVELDTHPTKSGSGRGRASSEVVLQRDLALAVAEFAPTSKLVANKKEWTSAGLKRVAGKEWERRHYKRCMRHSRFVQWKEGAAAPPDQCCDQMITGEYIDPIFGFVTARGEPDEPKRRPTRVFTTRPYFVGFSGAEPVEVCHHNIQITKTSPGTLVVLCEGRRGDGFCICQTCGAGFRQKTRQISRDHSSPLGAKCTGELKDHVSLGHEFLTDVVRLRFLLIPSLEGMEPLWLGYSLSYAIVEGASEILEIPSSDLNTTVTHLSAEDVLPSIVLYDNVPGGAGLVARLEDERVLRTTLEAALDRVGGACKCGEDTSCYSCLRSYRNQFAHSHLRRGPVKRYLEEILKKW